MSPVKYYDIKTIKDAWIEYQRTKFLRVLKDGKWETRPDSELDNIKGKKSAEIVCMSVKVSFPRFLEDNYG